MLGALLGEAPDLRGQTVADRPAEWPVRYAASFGFEVMADHNGLIIVASADSTRQAYKLGLRPGMQVLGWNTLPVKKKLDSMKIGRYRKSFPLMNDQNIRLMLLTRGRPGERAEVFFMTPTGNNRGISLTATVEAKGTPGNT
jgi:hypothetical protein